MNARVFLLLLITGFFIVIWNTDQTAMEAAIARHERGRSTALARHTPGARATRSSDPHLQEMLHSIFAASVVNGSGQMNILLAGITGDKTEQPDSFSDTTRGPLSDANLTTKVNAPALVFDSLAVQDPQQRAEPGSDSMTQVASDESLKHFDHLVASDSSIIATGEPVEQPRDGAVADAQSDDVRAGAIEEKATRLIIPVPRELSSGSWDVLSQSGDNFRITIERLTPGPVSSERFCIRSSPDGEEWCFVRSGQTAHIESEDVITEFWSASMGTESTNEGIRTESTPETLPPSAP